MLRNLTPVFIRWKKWRQQSCIEKYSNLTTLTFRFASNIIPFTLLYSSETSYINKCIVSINVREQHRRNKKWAIQRNWHHRVHKTKKNKTKTQHTICWTPLHTYNVNKTWALQQTTGGKDEPNIVFLMRKSHYLSQHLITNYFTKDQHIIYLKTFK